VSIADRSLVSAALPFLRAAAGRWRALLASDARAPTT